MAGSQGSRLAIAVCNAGGLGSLPCALLSVNDMQAELRAIKAATSAPFNVNFFCHENPVRDGARESAWREQLLLYYNELGISQDIIADAPARAPFSSVIADALEEFRPAFVSFHFGLPSRALVDRVKSWGSFIVSSATTVDEARWLEANGADAVIAQGNEAGGHRGMFLTDDITTQVGTMSLVPLVKAAVNIPVIAAGGIATASGARAAITLGASAVQIGTAFLSTPEAGTSALHRAALKSESANHTAITNVFTGRPARGIMNRAIRELGPLSAHAPQFPLASTAMLPLRKKLEEQGSDAFSPLWAGQSAALCKEMSAAELVSEIASSLQ